MTSSQPPVAWKSCSVWACGDGFTARVFRGPSGCGRGTSHLGPLKVWLQEGERSQWPPVACSSRALSAEL